MIWTIIELEEDIIVLNNVTKLKKNLIKTIRLRERTSLGVRYGRMDRPTYVRMDRGNTKCPGHCYGWGINRQHTYD